MAENEAPQDEKDAKARQSRSRSSIRFPYVSLSSAIEGTRMIHEKAGGQCDRAQLASILGYSSVRSGTFLSRIAAMKLFMLVEENRERGVYLSERGQAIVAPVDDSSRQQAQVEAFLSPDLFRKVFDEFYGKPLPPEAGLRNLIETKYGVVKSRVVPTVRIMLESAKYAGVLNATDKGTRMVRPWGTPPVEPEDPELSDHTGASDEKAGVETVNSSRSGANREASPDVENIDPALVALLRKLPASGTPLAPKRRKALVAAFNALIDFIYPSQDDDAY